MCITKFQTIYFFSNNDYDYVIYSFYFLINKSLGLEEGSPQSMIRAYSLITYINIYRSSINRELENRSQAIAMHERCINEVIQPC